MKIKQESDPDSKDEIIDQLEEELQRVKDRRDEDRFLFLLFVLIGFNVGIFMLVQNWAGALVIGVLEIVGLIILARRFGIQEVWTITQKVLNWNKANESKDGNSKE